MQLHQFSSQKYQKNKKRVGRGGKHGTFSGRGVKGQKSRAGRKLRPEWRDVLKRIPKRRGYRFKSLQVKPQVVNLEQLNIAFKENELVTARTLLNKGLIIKIKDRLPEIKVLGSGDLSKKLDFKGLAISQGAKQKITKAGGLIS